MQHLKHPAPESFAAPSFKRRLRRGAWLSGLAAALLAACGGGGGGGGGDSSSAAPAAEGERATALSASRPGELAAWAQEKQRAWLAQAYVPAITTGAGTINTLFTTDSIGITTTSSSPAAAAAPAAERSTSLAQEAGVDEADLLQSDGRHLYTLQAQNGTTLKLQVYARAAAGTAAPQALASLQLADAGAQYLATQGMHLNSDASALTVLSQSWFRVGDIVQPDCAGLCPTLVMPVSGRNAVGVQRVNVANPAAASAGDRLSMDGSLIDSRRIGDALYLVLAHTPFMPFQALPASATAAQREAAIAGTTAADVLPQLRRNGGPPEPLLSDTDCYVQARNASLAVAITTVTVIDLKSPSLARSSRCFAGGSEAIYMSPSSLYLATTRYDYPTTASASTTPYPAEIRTDIHKFALAAGTVAYKGSGSVAGHLGWDPQRKSFRLSEHQGDLRVLSFTGQFGWFTVQDATAGKPASPATLTVLRERSSDASLQVVSTLPNSSRPAAIGKPQEQVYGVRFVGDRAYVVTFRRTDPLYVLDLSNPADPKTVGELEVPGFSEHLFPFNNGLLLGVGRSADPASGRVDGLQVALFDVQDASKPKSLGQFKIGGAFSQLALDASRQGMNYLMKGHVARVALPARLVSPGFNSTDSGLLRFEVDTQARSLVSKPMLGQRSGFYAQDLGSERSLQIGDEVYYLSEGALKGYTW